MCISIALKLGTKWPLYSNAGSNPTPVCRAVTFGKDKTLFRVKFDEVEKR